MNDPSQHWENLYGQKSPAEVSWYRAHLERSLAFVDAAALGPDAALIDIGAGASTFVDDLLARGYRDITVLDLAANAIDVSKQRLGPLADQIHWLVGDITQQQLPENAYDFWHDRAVFHFLREPAQRERYVAAVRRALRPGGHIVVATFGPQGPERCSGLDVARYSADELHAQFGAQFRKVDSVTELHDTPSGRQQQFVYCYCRFG